jgi:aspartate/methionine/tyrosine aminotransferase
VLERLERAKHYTSICNAAPSEFLAAFALRHGAAIRARNRQIILDTLAEVEPIVEQHRDLVDWYRPDGGCVVFLRYRGGDGVEAFAQSLIEQHSAVVLPASIFQSELAPVPADRFRLGLGRRGQSAGWQAFAAHLASRSGLRRTA